MPIDHRLEGDSAWKRAAIRSEDYRVKLDGPCLDEIRRVVDDIRAYPLPTILRTPADFDMTNCHAAMAEVRRILKAFVDAQWLADFDQRLAAYHAHASSEQAAE